ncbi:MAG: citrate/2-methylcitrate synthase [Acutalibacteraceae bacterium]|nr:citrate/2-methylcitrate synthase [Acutalibacteraceae bacterium]
MSHKKFSAITPEIQELSKLCSQNDKIPPELFVQNKVNRGLRDAKGKGVLTGLTEISTSYSSREIDGVLTPIDGELYYRGIDINELVDGFLSENRFGFEETVYLLLFGELPDKNQLVEFNKLIANNRELPRNFARDVIMKASNGDIMNSLARSVLTLYSYDDLANDTSIPNVLKQSIRLISTFPLLAIYAYHAYIHFRKGKPLVIHNPNPKLSTAENILSMLRPDNKYTELEAKILDLALVLHAEHGGGNNSTFTDRVVTSSGTDTYSAIAASLCSLKGPKHGGANIKVCQMFDAMKKEIRDWTDEEEIRDYLKRMLNKEAFDKSGLIYGIGHAVYTVSDPRCNIFKNFVEKLAEEKGRKKEFVLYSNIHRLAPEVVAEHKQMQKKVSANIDFYSGFVYSMLDLPQELYTPIFAIARIAGWSAHRIEELVNSSKIIRPAYLSVQPERPYVKLEDR